MRKISNSFCLQILKGNVFARPAEWHFIFLDTRDRVFKYKKQAENGNKFAVNPKAVCKSLQMKDAYCQSGFTVSVMLNYKTVVF